MGIRSHKSRTRFKSHSPKQHHPPRHLSWYSEIPSPVTPYPSQPHPPISAGHPWAQPETWKGALTSWWHVGTWVKYDSRATTNSSNLDEEHSLHSFLVQRFSNLTRKRPKNGKFFCGEMGENIWKMLQRRAAERQTAEFYGIIEPLFSADRPPRKIRKREKQFFFQKKPFTLQLIIQYIMALRRLTFSVFEGVSAQFRRQSSPGLSGISGRSPMSFVAARTFASLLPSSPSRYVFFSRNSEIPSLFFLFFNAEFPPLQRRWKLVGIWSTLAVTAGIFPQSLNPLLCLTLLAKWMGAGVFWLEVAWPIATVDPRSRVSGWDSRPTRANIIFPGWDPVRSKRWGSMDERRGWPRRVVGLFLCDECSRVGQSGSGIIEDLVLHRLLE